MIFTNLITEHSPWYIVLCLIIALGYAVGLYFKNTSFGKALQWFLGFLRFSLVFILCLLLLSPFIKTVENIIRKPAIALMIDNSVSLIEQDPEVNSKILNTIKAIKNKLETNNNIEVDFFSFNGPINKTDSIIFDANSSNLSSMLNTIETNYDGMNLVGGILISDGIHNQGINPSYESFSYPVHTIGIGDSVDQQDIWIENISLNKTAYLNNKFPVNVKVGNQGFINQKSTLKVYYDSKIVANQDIYFSKSREFQNIKFLLDADSLGKHTIKITLKALDDEKLVQNNESQDYITVLSEKQKILICARSPHPDVKAINRMLSGKQLYNIENVVLSLDQKPKSTKYDLVVFHEIAAPSSAPNLNKELFDLNVLYIAPTLQSSKDLVKTMNLKFRFVKNQTDEALINFNDKNELIQLEPLERSLFKNLPPVQVPFFEQESSNGLVNILTQKIGNIETNKPLIAIRTLEKQKTGMILFDGLWKLRMNEKVYSSNNNDQQVLTKTFGKLVQYLSARTDKRQLLIEPLKPEFDTNEDIKLKIQVFNNIYEPVYDKAVNLNIDGQKIEFKPTKGTYILNLGKREEGVHDFKGSIEIANKQVVSTGQIVVRESKLEKSNLMADFKLLRTISNQNNGKFVYINEYEELIKHIKTKQFKDKIISSFEEFEDLLNKKWLFFVLLSLASLEWASRKYNGFI